MPAANITETDDERTPGHCSVHNGVLSRINRPQALTALPHRGGGRDVRRRVVVRPGRENLRGTIICRVKA